jgi:HlyD family secretion protein
MSEIKKSFARVQEFILRHKAWAVIVVLILFYAGFRTYSSLTSTAGEARYVIGEATKGTLVSSVSGSGQVGTVNLVDLKPKASGDIVYLGVAKNGTDVKAGTLIARIDPTVAEKAVRDARISLESAQLQLEKLQQPPDALSLTQSANALARAETQKQNAEDNLQKAYDDGFTSVSNAFLELPSVVSGLHDLLFSPNAQLGGINVNNIDYYANTANLFDPRGKTFGADADSKYQIALAKYNTNFQDFKTLSRSDSPEKITQLLTETYDTALAVSEAVKSTNNLIQFFEDQMTQHNKKIPTLADAQLSTLNGYTGNANALLTNLLNQVSTIKSDKNSILEATRTIDEETQSIAKLKAGTLPIDLKSAQITIDQRNATLRDALATLENYSIRAPFDGTIAKLNSTKGDTVSASTVVATLITKQKIAQISLNEVDAAKITVGQKATLTFDAIDALSIAGSVSDVDTVGTVSQGVVTYTVKIAFATQDDRVKSGMTANAAIITNVKQDVVLVPAGAVKTRGGASYVQVIDGVSAISDNTGIVSATAPREIAITVGATNDTSTEILSGLTEGAFIVTRTVLPTAAKTTTPSLLGGGGGVGRPRTN